MQSAACKPGPTRINGKPATQFCGPATAAIHAGKHWFRLGEGSCVATSKFFSINIGAIAPRSPNQTVPYLGLTLGQYPDAPKNRKPAGGDGVYHQGVLVIRWHGGAWDIKPWIRVVLWADRTGGRFSGRTTAYPHTAVSGTFSC